MILGPATLLFRILTKNCLGSLPTLTFFFKNLSSTFLSKQPQINFIERRSWRLPPKLRSWFGGGLLACPSGSKEREQLRGWPSSLEKCTVLGGVRCLCCRNWVECLGFLCRLGLRTPSGRCRCGRLALWRHLHLPGFGSKQWEVWHPAGLTLIGVEIPKGSWLWNLLALDFGPDVLL